MKKIYHLGTCSTNNKILKELNLKGVDLQDIKKEPISKNQIEEMARIAGSYEALFSRRAIKYRSLGLNEMKLSESDYKKYIIEEYTFLKRPVAIIDNNIFIGNSKKIIEDLKSKLNMG
ncbi:MAG: arsenate reductase [Flavobacteriales bacterium]|nr:arsenate reductase [Flavobacteriales bacterium]|tara:strand:+ start:528 stop:881 length:354 start_codon:yes stop_codon:yes gene_type:complete